MHDFMAQEPDPIEELLAPSAAPPDTSALRQDLLARTRRDLRMQRSARRLAWAAALAACYGAGLLTMRWFMTPARPPEPAPLARQEEKTPIAQAAKQAVALEWEAVDRPDQQAALYRQAGDRYLTEEGDIAAALRCYGNALDSGTPEDLTTSSTDNWLLMAIKDARKKEKHDAKDGI
jgi:hypothetical protein